MIERDWSRIGYVQDLVFVVNGYAVDISNVYTFKFDLLEFFSGKIDFEQSFGCSVVESGIITGHANSIDSSGTGEAADGGGLVAVSRNSHNISIVESCVDGSIFGEGKVLGADEMSLVFDQSGIFKVVGVDKFIEVEVERRHVNRECFVFPEILVPLGSFLDAPKYEPKDEDETEFAELVYHLVRYSFEF